jgi:hypothetical protein
MGHYEHEYCEEDDERWEGDYHDDDDFADPGGESALRAETETNPRNQPCPTCKWPNRLTPADKRHGYQCDSCATANEHGLEINYYEGGDAEEEEEDCNG